MRPRPLAAAALAAALTAQACLGAGIRWFDTYEEAEGLAKDTGRPLVAVVVQKGKVNDLKKTFLKPKLLRFGRVFLFCYEEVEIVNNTIRSRLLAKFRFQGQLRLPYFFFADATGKVLGQTQDGSPGNLNDMLLIAYKKHGPVADPKTLKTALAKLKRADELYESGKYGPAASLYRQVAELKAKAPPVEAAKGKLAEIEQLATQRLADARADLEAKSYAKAIDRLSELAADFGALEAGQAARKELARLRTVPEAKEALAAAADRRASKGTDDSGATVSVVALDEADWKLDGFTDEELDALDAMAPGAEPAEAKPAAAKSDAVARKCRRLIGLARNWIANKQPDKARRYLQQVIDQHPDTLYADQAKALLEGMK